jgi:hypothetical protein
MKKSIYLIVLSLFYAIKPFSQNVITVTDCNLNGWVKDQRGNSMIMFNNGPASPPLGKGSFHFVTPDQSFGRLRNGQYSGTSLSTITELSYSTFIEHRDSIVDVNFIVLLVDVNGDNTAEYNLVFDPRYQSQPFVGNNLPDQGKTQVGTWQNWDALHGGWFIGPDPKDDPDHGGTFFNLDTFISRFPNARIMNDVAKGGAAIRLTVGGPVFSNNFIGDADNFKIGINGVTTTYDFEFTIANAGDNKDVIYGYGSNCTTLTGTASGGVAPYSYSWSPGGNTPNNISTQVCPTVTSTYTLTVTDANGCTGTDEVIVNVNDVRCGDKSDKVKICHNGEEICVAKEAVPAHLKHGDALGSCQQEPVTRINYTLDKETTDILPQFRLSNYPNPFTAITRIEYELPTDGNVSLKVYNLSGKEIATLANGYKKQGKYFVDFAPTRLNPGVYYYKISVCSEAKIFTQTSKMIFVH